MAQDTLPRTGVIDSFRLDIGKKLAAFVDGLAQKVVFVISGDLSHAHPTDVTDPLYLPAPG
jgi:aromatic ring-opening dioxygenase LigB subunit